MASFQAEISSDDDSDEVGEVGHPNGLAPRGIAPSSLQTHVAILFRQSITLATSLCTVIVRVFLSHIKVIVYGFREQSVVIFWYFNTV